MKKTNLAAVVLFCGFLFAMCAGLFLLPKAEFSEMEKRYLAEPPKLTLQSLFSGEWSKGAEEFITDHVPGRNLFVGINAYLERLAGRQGLKDVRVWENKLLEAPVALDEAAIARNMGAIEKFANAVNQQVDVMVVPSAGWSSGAEGYRDGEALQAIYASAQGNVNPVPVEHLYAGKPELYYNTDHHWTSQGAHLGYAAYMEALGRDFRKAEDFQVTTAEGFQGSTYSRSALWLTPGETLELWQGSENLTVTNAETEGVHQGIFYPERLQEADKYTAFLDGNHSIVRIQNPDKEGKLLVIRDSYGNCLGGFLAESYGEVVLIDLRYYRAPVSALVMEEGFDNILVCYNALNFQTDTNLMLLR